MLYGKRVDFPASKTTNYYVYAGTLHARHHYNNIRQQAARNGRTVARPTVSGAGAVGRDVPTPRSRIARRLSIDSWTTRGRRRRRRRGGPVAARVVGPGRRRYVIAPSCTERTQRRTVTVVGTHVVVVVGPRATLKTHKSIFHDTVVITLQRSGKISYRRPAARDGLASQPARTVQ